MVAGITWTRAALVGAACAAVFLGLGAANAFATVNATANASDCSGTSCSNFRVSMWGSTISPNRSGTVCFNGHCLSTKSNSEGVFIADFNTVGPYKSGSKTTARLSYRGRYYNRSVRITCGC